VAGSRRDLRGWKGERGNSGNFSALSAGAYTTTWLMMVTYSVHLLLCPSKIFRQENKNTLFSLLWYIQRYLKIIIIIISFELIFK
jgi:hypothetical protein